MTVEEIEVAERPTAVIAAATTWREFPRLWKALLDEVYTPCTAARSPACTRRTRPCSTGAPSTAARCQACAGRSPAITTRTRLS